MGERPIDRAIRIFKEHNGVLRTREALRKGIHPSILYAMRDDGLIEPLARGVYYLADSPLPGELDLVTVALAIPNARICLISALAFHRLTTQIPRSIDIALPRDSWKPKLDYPPVRFFFYGREAIDLGLEEHRIDGKTIHIYSPARTVVDCFKFRSRIGLEIALEALKDYLRDNHGTVDDLMQMAQALRMEKIMRPYVQGMISD